MHCIPCTRRGQRWPRSCASHRMRTRQGNDGNLPSYNYCQRSAYRHINVEHSFHATRDIVDIHLVVEDLALASLSLRDEALVEHVEHILTDVLELRLDLLTILADDADVLLRALGLLFLLDAGDDAPRCAARADYVLVGNGEQVTLVDCKLAADLTWLY